VCEVGRVFPRHVQRTYLTGESPLGRPRVARTLQLYNYLLRFYLTATTYYISTRATKASRGYITTTAKLLYIYRVT